MADLKTLMEDIARAIRLKTGNSDKINAQDFPQKIREIETGGTIQKNTDVKGNINIITPINILNIAEIKRNISTFTNIEIIN